LHLAHAREGRQFCFDEFIKTKNLRTSQRAMVAARVKDVYEREAKERQKVRKGNQAGSSVEDLPQLETGKARDKAGQAKRFCCGNVATRKTLRKICLRVYGPSRGRGCGNIATCCRRFR